MNYCKVEGNKIVEGPKSLSIIRKEILESSSLPIAELKQTGWLPVEYPIAEFNPITQKRLADTYEVLSDKVVVSFNYGNKTEAEMEAEAIEALKIPELGDMEAVGHIRDFLKTKFENDPLFPVELK